LTPEEAPEYQDYLRVLQWSRELERRNAIDIVYETYPSGGAPPRLALQIAPDALLFPETQALVQILGLTPGKTHYPLVFPAAQHLQPRNSDLLRVETRSLLGMLYYLSQAVEVPERDRQKAGADKCAKECRTSCRSEQRQVLSPSRHGKMRAINTETGEVHQTGDYNSRCDISLLREPRLQQKWASQCPLIA
jgi:hypothetical protein